MKASSQKNHFFVEVFGLDLNLTEILAYKGFKGQNFGFCSVLRSFLFQILVILVVSGQNFGF